MPEKELIIRLSVFDKKEDLNMEKLNLNLVWVLSNWWSVRVFYLDSLKKKKKVLNFLKFILQLGKPHQDPGTFKQSSVSM